LAHRTAYRVGPHRIGWALGEAHFTVQAVPCRHGVAHLAELDRPTRQVVRYQRQRPGELVTWTAVSEGGSQMVVATASHGRQRARGGQRKQGPGYDFLHMAVDDRSRMAYLEVQAAAGVAHQRTRPDRPATNGKAERLNRTIEQEWAHAKAYTSNQAPPGHPPGLAALLQPARHIGPLTEGAPCDSSTTSPTHTWPA
jgi:hypothetical protein